MEVSGSVLMFCFVGVVLALLMSFSAVEMFNRPVPENLGKFLRKADAYLHSMEKSIVSQRKWRFWYGCVQCDAVLALVKQTLEDPSLSDDVKSKLRDVLNIFAEVKQEYDASDHKTLPDEQVLSNISTRLQSVLNSLEKGKEECVP